MIYTPAKIAAMYQARAKYATEFGRVVRYLQAEGLIGALEQLGENAYSCRCLSRGFSDIAYESAGECSQGLFSVIGENAGMRWGMGPYTGGVLIKPGSVEGLKRAQEIVRQVIPDAECPPESWTFGGNARQLIKWSMSEEQSFGGYAEQIAKAGADGDQSYQYHECKPGRYKNVKMYDAESYYFSLLSRLPSLRCWLHPDGVEWGRWQAGEQEKWNSIIGLIGNTYILRNSVWGVLLGSTAKRLAYTSAPLKGLSAGKVRILQVRYQPGPFRQAALLIARSAAEVCALASHEVDSVYSTVDCVTTTEGREPTAWSNLGLQCRIKEEGIADIVARGVWRIGDHHTIPYAKDRTLPENYLCPAERVPVSRRFYTMNYHRLWLA